MDILPLVYQSPSLNIVVVRLTDSLNDRPRVCFFEEGRDVYTLPDRLVLSNRDFIIRMCQIAASCSASGGIVPYVMIIATHLDILGSSGSAKVREFNEGLADVRKEFSHVLICKSKNETIFPINAMAVSEERQQYTKELQECITSVTQHVLPIKVPLRWLVYQLHLDKDEGIVRLPDCYREGLSLKMRKHDVDNALKFFSKMALILYFPDDIPDLVLTKMDPLTTRLSKLVKTSFIPPKHCPPAESDKLRIKGLFHKNYLPKVFKDIENDSLNDDEFLKLLECLKIAVRVGKQGEYFLPSALSFEPQSEGTAFKMFSIPLVFSWGERLLPHGFFFTVAIEMMGQYGEYKFELCTTVDQWRREIQVSEVAGKIPGVVKLTNKIKWIQISTTSNPKNCRTIYKIVKSAIQKTVKRFKHLKIGPPAKPATLCRLCDNTDHYCVLTGDRLEFTCSVDKTKTGAVTHDMMCWFESKFY